MKIKRLYLTDDPSPSARKELCWEDEYGNWAVGDTNSPNAFAQGLLIPGCIDRESIGAHPELKECTVFSDWLTKGETGQSSEVMCIVEPVLVEAYRRWNAGWYDNEPVGEIELPKPGMWTIDPVGNHIVRVRDI